MPTRRQGLGECTPPRVGLAQRRGGSCSCVSVPPLSQSLTPAHPGTPRHTPASRPDIPHDLRPFVRLLHSSETAAWLTSGPGGRATAAGAATPAPPPRTRTRAASRPPASPSRSKTPSRSPSASRSPPAVDTDRDGVMDGGDLCPASAGTLTLQTVSALGCAHLQVTLIEPMPSWRPIPQPASLQARRAPHPCPVIVSYRSFVCSRQAVAAKA